MSENNHNLIEAVITEIRDGGAWQFMAKQAEASCEALRKELDAHRSANRAMEGALKDAVERMNEAQTAKGRVTALTIENDQLRFAVVRDSRYRKYIQELYDVADAYLDVSSRPGKSKNVDTIKSAGDRLKRKLKEIYAAGTIVPF